MFPVLFTIPETLTKQMMYAIMIIPRVAWIVSDLIFYALVPSPQPPPKQESRKEEKRQKLIKLLFAKETPKKNPALIVTWYIKFPCHHPMK